MGVYLIAEAGACHDGDLEQALRLVEVAARCGANACKFQYASKAERLVERRNAPEYLEAYRLLEFPVSWFDVLRKQCDEHRIDLMTTTYLPEDIPWVAPYVDRFKIASFESQDTAFLHAHAEYGKPITVSTGMRDALPIGRAQFTQHAGQLAVRVFWLHCTSAYPAPLSEMNLGVIRAYGLDGLSDHSGDMAMGALAVAAGARIIETHIKLGTTNPANPDAGPHALLPDRYDEYVRRTRLAEVAMGTGVKVIQPSEAAMMRYLVR